MSRMPPFFRVLAVNALVFLGLLAAVEIVMGNWTGPAPREAGFTCFDPVLHHRYCGSIAHRNRMAGPDGGRWIVNATDALGNMVADGGSDAVSGLESADILLIGDSFMQADEMSWNDRMGQIIAQQTGLVVRTVGYSSWAPAIQTNWLLGQVLKPGAHVAYFVMLNDFTPTYGNANLHYHAELPGQDFPLAFVPRRADEQAEAPVLGWQEEISLRSFVLSRLRAALQAHSATAAPQPVDPLLDAETIAETTCAGMQPTLDRLPEGSLLGDYLYLSLAADCWPEIMKQGVDQAVEDIRIAYNSVASAGGSMHVYLIPPGWAFADENMIGKAVQPQFGLAPDATIGQRGIATYMAGELGTLNIPFSDLEQVIDDLKMEATGQFYFPADGHWTPLAHRLLAPHIAADFSAAR